MTDGGRAPGSACSSLPNFAVEQAAFDLGNACDCLYGADFAATYRRAATFDKILKDARPGELPVEQPTTYDLVMNLKTAEALGLTIPPSVLRRAAQVIP